LALSDIARPEFVGNVAKPEVEDKEVPETSCIPMLMFMDLPAPLSPKTMIFGEPVLQKYYTVFDAIVPQVGFATAHHIKPKLQAWESHVADHVDTI